MSMGVGWITPSDLLSQGSVAFTAFGHSIIKGSSAGQTQSALRSVKTGGNSQFLQFRLDGLSEATEFYVELINFISLNTLARRVGYIRGNNGALDIGVYVQTVLGERTDEHEWSDPAYGTWTAKTIRLESFSGRQRLRVGDVLYIDEVASTPKVVGKYQGITMWWI